jgi:uncharacterized membrane protein YeiB
MALTDYILQSVICTTIFYGHGLGLFGRVERIEQLGIVVAIWVVQLVLSPIWLRYFLFGPLEWLWRSLTYWSVEPILRSATMRCTTLGFSRGAGVTSVTLAGTERVLRSPENL